MSINKHPKRYMVFKNGICVMYLGERKYQRLKDLEKEGFTVLRAIHL